MPAASAESPEALWTSAESVSPEISLKESQSEMQNSETSAYMMMDSLSDGSPLQHVTTEMKESDMKIDDAAVADAPKPTYIGYEAYERKDEAEQPLEYFYFPEVSAEETENAGARYEYTLTDPNISAPNEDSNYHYDYTQPDQTQYMNYNYYDYSYQDPYQKQRQAFLKWQEEVKEAFMRSSYHSEGYSLQISYAATEQMYPQESYDIVSFGSFSDEYAMQHTAFAYRIKPAPEQSFADWRAEMQYSFNMSGYPQKGYSFEIMDAESLKRFVEEGYEWGLLGNFTDRMGMTQAAVALRQPINNPNPNPDPGQTFAQWRSEMQYAFNIYGYSQSDYTFEIMDAVGVNGFIAAGHDVISLGNFTDAVGVTHIAVAFRKSMNGPNPDPGQTFAEWRAEMEYSFHMSGYSQRGYSFEIMDAETLKGFVEAGYEWSLLGSFIDEMGVSHAAIALGQPISNPNPDPDPDPDPGQTFAQWRAEMEQSFKMKGYSLNGYAFEIMDEAVMNVFIAAGHEVILLGTFTDEMGMTHAALAFRQPITNPDPDPGQTFAEWRAEMEYFFDMSGHSHNGYAFEIMDAVGLDAFTAEGHEVISLGSFTDAAGMTHIAFAFRKSGNDQNPNDPPLGRQELPRGFAGQYYTMRIAVEEGGTPAPGIVLPYRVESLSSVPPGLTFDSGTQVLSGIPSTQGSYEFVGRIVDANGRFVANWIYTIEIGVEESPYPDSDPRQDFAQWRAEMQNSFNMNGYAQNGYFFEIMGAENVEILITAGHEVTRLGSFTDEMGITHTAIAFRQSVPNPDPDPDPRQTFAEWSAEMKNLFSLNGYPQNGYSFEIMDAESLERFTAAGYNVTRLGTFTDDMGITFVAIAYLQRIPDPDPDPDPDPRQTFEEWRLEMEQSFKVKGYSHNGYSFEIMDAENVEGFILAGNDVIYLGTFTDDMGRTHAAIAFRQRILDPDPDPDPDPRQTFEEWRLEMEQSFKMKGYSQDGFFFEIMDAELVEGFMAAGHEVIYLGTFTDDMGRTHAAIAFRQRILDPDPDPDPDPNPGLDIRAIINEANRIKAALRVDPSSVSDDARSSVYEQLAQALEAALKEDRALILDLLNAVYEYQPSANERVDLILRVINGLALYFDYGGANAADFAVRERAHRAQMLYLALENLPGAVTRDIARAMFTLYEDSYLFNPSVRSLVFNWTARTEESGYTLALGGLLQYMNANLPDAHPKRTYIIDGFTAVLAARPGLLEEFKTHIPLPNEAPWGRLELDYFQSAGMLARSAGDREKVIAAILPNADQAALFRDKGVFVVHGARDFSAQEFHDFRKWIGQYPDAMVRNVVMLSGGIQFQAVGGPDYGKSGYSLNFTDLKQFAYNLLGKPMVNSTQSENNLRWVFDHELGHQFLDQLERENLLPEKRWMRKELFALGTPEDRPTEGFQGCFKEEPTCTDPSLAYANGNAFENAAEFFSGIMDDSVYFLDKWIQKARDGRFIGLRTHLSVLEVLAHNLNGNIPFHAPYHKGSGSGASVNVPVQRDAMHNITRFQMPALANPPFNVSAASASSLYNKIFEFQYTPDGLHLTRVVIRNAADGTILETLLNPAVPGPSAAGSGGAFVSGNSDQHAEEDGHHEGDGCGHAHPEQAIFKTGGMQQFTNTPEAKEPLVSEKPQPEPQMISDPFVPEISIKQSTPTPGTDAETVLQETGSAKTEPVAPAKPADKEPVIESIKPINSEPAVLSSVESLRKYYELVPTAVLSSSSTRLTKAVPVNLGGNTGAVNSSSAGSGQPELRAAAVSLNIRSAAPARPATLTPVTLLTVRRAAEPEPSSTDAEISNDEEKEAVRNTVTQVTYSQPSTLQNPAMIRPVELERKSLLSAVTTALLWWDTPKKKEPARKSGLTLLTDPEYQQLN